MLRRILLCAVFGACIPAIQVGTAQPRQFAVVAYLPEWRYSAFDFGTLADISHLIFFSGEPSEDGEILGMDRLPDEALAAEARAAADKNGARLLLCFGGNGRSSHFSAVVRNDRLRRLFASRAAALVARLSFDGVDVNWEYPCFSFGRGYDSASCNADYVGLALLLRDLRSALGKTKLVTLAYYPDGRQESALASSGAASAADLLHMMAYDAPGAAHSSLELALDSIALGVSHLPMEKLTLGVPFYGRNTATGDWVTYEDLLKEHSGASLAAAGDFVPARDSSAGISFNGRATLAEKVRRAVAAGLGGVMIWEAGQDCRVHSVARRGKVHGKTCQRGYDDSLLAALVGAVRECGQLAIRAQSTDGVVGSEL